MKTGIDLCESYLERKLAEAMARQSRFVWRKPGDHRYEIGTFDGWAIALLAQVKVPPYRVDFMLCSFSQNDARDKPWIVIVEVDGHDFHERTKDQARRDKSRDRALAAVGARVLRFTGQEVHEDAEACAHEAVALAIELQNTNLNDQFEVWLDDAVEEIKKNREAAATL